MTIIHRYITRRFITWSVFFILVFIFLYEIIDLFEHLDDFITAKANFKIILSYYFLFIPPILVRIIPVALLLSTLFVLGYMSRTNEITALKACGVSLYNLILPIMKLALVFSFCVFLINETIVPNSFSKLDTLKEDNWTQPKLSKIFHNVTFYGSERKFYYLKTFNYPEKTIEGILVLEYYPNRTIKFRIDAEKGFWKDNIWTFQNGIIRYFNEQERLDKEEVFKEKKIYYRETPADFLRQQKKLETMSFFTLAKYTKYLKENGFHPHQELVEIQYRLAFPLISFFIILLGIPFSLQINRGGLLYSVGISLTLCLFYYACISLALALGKQRGFPPFLSAWSANIIFGGIGLLLLKRTPQ